MAGNETDALLAMMPFAAVLGIEEVTALPEQVTGRVRWDESRCTSFGVLHGGVLMSLADSIGAYCAGLHPPGGAATSTIEIKDELPARSPLRPCRGTGAAAPRGE